MIETPINEFIKFNSVFLLIEQLQGEVEKLEDKLNNLEQNKEISTVYTINIEENKDIMGNTSFATNANDYVTVQLRTSGQGIHVQGLGVGGNRNYGFAENFTAPIDFTNWLNDQDHTNPSLANSGKHYVEAQVAVRGDKCHFQVNGEELNREYGAAFDVTSSMVAGFITATLAAQEKAEQEAQKAAELAAAKAKVSFDVVLS